MEILLEIEADDSASAPSFESSEAATITKSYLQGEIRKEKNGLSLLSGIV